MDMIIDVFPTLQPDRATRFFEGGMPKSIPFPIPGRKSDGRVQYQQAPDAIQQAPNDYLLQLSQRPPTAFPATTKKQQQRKQQQKNKARLTADRLRDAAGMD